MDCNTCKEKRLEPVPYFSHEKDMDIMNRINKRWFVAWLITFILLVSVVAGFIWYESQWQVMEETTTMEVEQDADNGGINRFVGGNYYGAAESESYEDLEEEGS